MNKKSQISFLKRLHMLIKAGISLEESLVSMSSFVRKKNKKEIHMYEKILESIQQGKHLSESIKTSTSFDPLSISLIKAGEQSGTLQENLYFAAETLIKRQKLKSAILSSLMYPILIAGMTVLLSCFLLFVIFPKIKPLFASFKMQLPLSTRILMSLSSFLQRYGLFIIIIIILIFFLYIFLEKKYESIRFRKDKFLLSLPFIKTCIIYYQTAIISRSIGVMLKGGLSIDESVLLARDSLFNHIYKKLLYELHEDVQIGRSISESLQEAKHLIPPESLILIATAETTGTLPETLLYNSEILEEQVETLSQTFARFLEPLLMIAMGCIVGFVALSMLTPIYGITQNLHH